MGKEGSFARDVGCNSNNLCLVTLNHDGLVVIDLTAAAGVQIITSHAETFNTDQIPVAVYRMFSGAQKVYPSKKDPNGFYVEGSTMDWATFVNDTSLARSISWKSVYLVELEPAYERGNPSVRLTDPIVTARFSINQSWTSVQETLVLTGNVGTSSEDKFDNLLVDAFAVSVREDRSRFAVVSTTYTEKIETTFQILPDAGPSPLTVFNMLKRQVGTKNSAIYGTNLAPVLGTANLVRINGFMQDDATPITDKDDSDNDEEEPKEFNLREQILVLSLMVSFFLIMLLCAMICCCMLYNENIDLKKQLAARSTVVKPFLPKEDDFIFGGQPTDGYVIGMPAAAGGKIQASKNKNDNNSDDSELEEVPLKEIPIADNVQVIGDPVKTVAVRAPVRGEKK